MLTVRAEPGEARLLRDVLEQHRDAVMETVADRRQCVHGGVDKDVEQGYAELFLVTRLLDDLRDSGSVGEQREFVGPTWLLDPILRSAAAEAVTRLSDAIDAFRSDTARIGPEQLRSALEVTCACTATLIGLDHAQNHAVE
jgi:hypothetical protein